MLAGESTISKYSTSLFSWDLLFKERICSLGSYYRADPLLDESMVHRNAKRKSGVLLKK